MLFSRFRIRRWLKRNGPRYAERRLRRNGYSQREAKIAISEAKRA